MTICVGKGWIGCVLTLGCSAGGTCSGTSIDGFDDDGAVAWGVCTLGCSPVWCVCAFWKISVRSDRAFRWFVFNGGRIEFCDCWDKVLVRSLAAASSRSEVEAVGIGILCGNHVIVWTMRSDDVDGTHARWQR